MNGNNTAVTPENYADYLASLDVLAGLGAHELSLLLQCTQWVDLSEGQLLFQEGEPADAMYFVVRGQMSVLARDKSGGAQQVARLGPGDTVGEISLISGVKRTAAIQANGPSALIRLPRDAFERLVSEAPQVIERITKLARRRLERDQFLHVLPSYVAILGEKARSEVEAQLQWIELARGQTLFREGDTSDSVYLVVIGRLRVFTEGNSGKPKVLREVSQGEIVGEMGFFAQKPRSASICAIRDSTLVRIDKSVFAIMLKEHPEVMMAIVQRLIARLNNYQEEKTYKRSLTIAIVPAHAGVSITPFSERFAQALSKYGTSFRLNRDRFVQLTGIRNGTEKLAPSDPYSIRLRSWLDQQEQAHNFVIYDADSKSSTWSAYCVQQADVVILLANANGERSLGELAQALTNDKSDIATPTLSLVLLHEASEEAPKETSEWLKLTKADRHTHVRRGRMSDFERLARIVSGKAIGLVLGGGGARGFAHIGVIRAIEEAGIPIDVIGGTSMGAIISAQYAMGWRYTEMLEWNRRTLIEMRPLKEYTLPVISLTRGIKGAKIGTMIYGDRQIEDLWIDYFCVSTSLSRAKAIIHEKGLLRKAVTASSALPGILVPVIDRGDVLIDGALLNNLPCDVMKSKCQGDVIAVDVGSHLQLEIKDEAMPSPWKVASSRLLPFRKPIKTVTIFDILLGATFVGGKSNSEQIK
ncbi:MAG: cyclic nucleotide-binding domain-containing protein, partial [Burkholderiales bacterium]|nr:cyclic nucleotide-binding domain-containing protein [Burkholderiales bacterium]